MQLIRLWLPVALFIIGILSPCCAQDSVIPDESEQDELVVEHNSHRADAGAANMYKLKWSEDLANLSLVYVEGCDESAPAAVESDVGYNAILYTGQLIFWKIVELWQGGSDYYVDGECQGNLSQCNRYLQLVWWNVSEVGCAYKECSANTHLVTCFYHQGYPDDKHPFEPGARCSACPNGWCKNGFCSRECDEDPSRCECSRVCENCGTLDPSTCTCSCVAGYEGDTCSNQTSVTSVCHTSTAIPSTQPPVTTNTIIPSLGTTGEITLPLTKTTARPTIPSSGTTVDITVPSKEVTEETTLPLKFSQGTSEIIIPSTGITDMNTLGATTGVLQGTTDTETISIKATAVATMGDTTVVSEAKSDGTTVVFEATTEEFSMSSERTIITEVTLPSEATLDEVTLPSGATLDGVTLLSEATLDEVTLPSEATLDEVTLPSEATLDEVTLPSEATLDEVTLPSKANLDEVTLPSEATLDEVTLPSEATLDEVTLPSEATLDEVTLPSEATLNEVTLPSEATVVDVTLPSEATIAELTLPSDATIVEVTFPSEATVAEVTMLSGATLPEVTLPSEATTVDATLPSEATIAELTLPSEATIVEVTFPSGATVAEVTIAEVTELTLPSEATIVDVTLPSEATNSELTLPPEATVAEITLHSEATVATVSLPTEETEVTSKSTKISPNITTPTIITPTVITPTVITPTIITQTVITPIVSTPTLSTPTLSTLSTPTLSTPTISTPTVSTPHTIATTRMGSTPPGTVTTPVSTLGPDCTDHCLHGGIPYAKNDKCKCRCNNHWRGARCKKRRKNGMTLTLLAIVPDVLWSRVWLSIQRGFSTGINSYCGRNVKNCCPASRVSVLTGYEYVTISQIELGDGTPTSSGGKTYVNIYINVNIRNPLCRAANRGKNRRKRQDQESEEPVDDIELDDSVLSDFTDSVRASLEDSLQDLNVTVGVVGPADNVTLPQGVNILDFQPLDLTSSTTEALTQTTTLSVPSNTKPVSLYLIIGIVAGVLVILALLMLTLILCLKRSGNRNRPLDFATEFQVNGFGKSWWRRSHNYPQLQYAPSYSYF